MFVTCLATPENIEWQCIFHWSRPLYHQRLVPSTLRWKWIISIYSPGEDDGNDFRTGQRILKMPNLYARIGLASLKFSVLSISWSAMKDSPLSIARWYPPLGHPFFWKYSLTTSQNSNISWKTTANIKQKCLFLIDADTISSMYRAAKDSVLFSYKILFIWKYLQYSGTGSYNGIKIYNHGRNGIWADLNI